MDTGHRYPADLYERSAGYLASAKLDTFVSMSASGVDGTRLEVAGLRKSFGATQALRDCSLEVRRGQVHALMGENGSGKSTLVKLLSGVHRPDAGTMTVAGERFTKFGSPRAAIQVGISTVFQEILVVPQRSILTNIWLGSDGIVRRSRSMSDCRRLASETLNELIDVNDLDAPAGELSLSDRQAVCIARALVCEPALLILDEATSALDVAVRENLFTVLARLKERGTGILFISHRMDEVEEIADQITVLRSGEKVGTAARGEITPRELVEMMTGVEHVAEDVPENAELPVGAAKQVVLRAERIRLQGGTKPIDVEIRAGEIVGLAGLEGHGQDHFLQVLAGASPADGSVLRADGSGERKIASRAGARRSGIAYVPRDRRDDSIFETRSILDNFQLTTVTADRRVGLVRRSLAGKRFEGFVDVLKITAGRRTNLITSLSGGNQQKVILARWLAMGPSVLLLNDPTRGVDMGAKQDIYRFLRTAANDGVAVVILSTELVELVEIADRVLVFRESELFCDLRREQVTRNRLVASYFGQEHE